MNTGTYVLRAAEQRPDAVAIRHGDDTITWAEFAERCLRLGRVYRDLGLVDGDRVALVQHNSPAMLESMYAAFLAGLAVVPVNARLHPREIAYIAGNAGAGAIVHTPEFNEGLAEVADELPDGIHRLSTVPSTGELDLAVERDRAVPLAGATEVDNDGVAWLFYTSGTTGRPKGVIWSHRTIRLILMNYLTDVDNLQPEDVVLHAAPLSHGSGVVALPAIARGSENVILSTLSFDPAEVFRLIERRGVTNIAFLAPTQIVKLLEEFDASADLSSLRAVCYGGAPMYVEDLKRAIDTFGPVFVQIFGQGESPLTITGLRRQDHVRFRASDDPRLGSAGVARTDVEVRIGDDNDEPLPPNTPGEILVRGDVVMPGYWDDPQATAEALRNGWLHTGDVGVLDEHGYLFIHDRSKDMIISGGNNIYPREVEEVLLTLPEVHEVCVFGVPDDYWGESVHALVALHDGAELTAEQVIAHSEDNLARYKRPSSVEFVQELPKNAYGKIVKRELRERYWDGYERRVGGGVKGD